VQTDRNLGRHHRLARNALAAKNILSPAVLGIQPGCVVALVSRQPPGASRYVAGSRVQIENDVEVLEGYCRFHPRGSVSLVEAVELVTRAIAFCREQRIPRLLVNITGLTQFSVPTLVDRYLMVEEWAREARGMVAVAMVAMPEHIHPEKFGVKAAADSGLRGDIFTSERDALEWLLAGSTGAADGTGT